MCLHVQSQWGQLGLWESEVGPAAGAGAPAGGIPAPGLSYAYKCPDRVPVVGEFRIRTPLNGGCVRVSEVGSKRPSRSLEGCKRGMVKGFSRGSRLRMLELLQSIDRAKILGVWFATLTVPAGECDWKGIERHRRAWLKRFDRAYPASASIIWKKEPHKSGFPHLHALILWAVPIPDVHAFRKWNDAAWADVVKSDNPAHASVGCKVEPMRTWNGVAWYAGKYLSKNSETDIKETGRIWGVHNRALLAKTIDEEVVAPEVGKRVRRTLRKLQERKKTHWEERIQRKDGSFVWVPVRGHTCKMKMTGGGFDFHYFTVEDQVRSAKRNSRRIRYVKGRALSRRTVPIWGEVTEQSWSLGEVKKIEKIGEEKSSFASSLHFVRSEDAKRLVQYWKGRVAADLVYAAEAVEAANLPF